MPLLSDLALLHKQQLQKSHEIFNDPSDFERHLRTAVREVGAFSDLLNSIASIPLTAGVGAYALPADFGSFGGADWGPGCRLDTGRQSRVLSANPSFGVVLGDPPELKIEPIPTLSMIDKYGDTLELAYGVAPTATTELPEEATNLILLRALLEALRELSLQAIRAPVQIHRGVSEEPTKGTPFELLEHYQKVWETRVGLNVKDVAVA